ncbi:MAG: anhydro-N-acetylmuramic acid kinase [Sphingomonadales bacterium]|jgi:anhydro-N-acetylmuramic acid kinase
MYTALGLMSGTSMDGIDIALMKSDGKHMLDFGPTDFLAYSQDFRSRLAEAMSTCRALPTEALFSSHFTELEAELTQLHVDAVLQFLKGHDLEPQDIDVIGFHGQTLIHRPDEQFTWQIGEGAMLAHKTGVKVVNDFRSADMTQGGEGAPLAPIYHEALVAYHNIERPTLMLNLGGVGNVTYIGNDGQLIAFDTGPANALIDDWVQQKTGETHDMGGKLARKGVVDEAYVNELLTHPYFQKPVPKSLDRNDFQFEFSNKMSVEDGAATLTAFTVDSVKSAFKYFPDRPKQIIVMGGGRHNKTMMDMLETRLSMPTRSCDDLGMNGDAVEAQAFAYMAIRRLLDLPISFPGTTGVKKEITGGVIHTAGNSV